MKITVTAIMIFLLVNASLPAQVLKTDQVPGPVLSTFASRFPAAENTVWELKKDQYKAEFKIGKRGHDLWLDKSGVVTKHKQDFPKGELPEAIRQKVEAEFSTYKIDDADKIEEGAAVLYQLDLKSEGGKRKVIFTPEGIIRENKEN